MWSEESRWKAGGKQAEQLLHACPGTPVQGSQSPASAPGREMHLGCLVPTCLPSRAGAEADERQRALSPAASNNISPHTIVYQLKMILSLKLLNKMFLNSHSSFQKHFLQILVWFIALEMHEAYSRLNFALHTNYALHFLGLL